MTRSAIVNWIHLSGANIINNYNDNRSRYFCCIKMKPFAQIPNGKLCSVWKDIIGIICIADSSNRASVRA